MAILSATHVPETPAPDESLTFDSTLTPDVVSSTCDLTLTRLIWGSSSPSSSEEVSLEVSSSTTTAFFFLPPVVLIGEARAPGPGTYSIKAHGRHSR